MPTDRFIEFAEAQAEWSRATFGSDEERGPLGPLKHLAKEVQECLSDPTDKMEYADLLFLVLDASRRAKIPAAELLDCCFQKLEINKARTWQKPTKDGAVEHVRNAN